VRDLLGVQPPAPSRHGQRFGQRQRKAAVQTRCAIGAGSVGESCLLFLEKSSMIASSWPKILRQRSGLRSDPKGVGDAFLKVLRTYLDAA